MILSLIRAARQFSHTSPVSKQVGPRRLTMRGNGIIYHGLRFMSSATFADGTPGDLFISI